MDAMGVWLTRDLPRSLLHPLQVCSQFWARLAELVFMEDDRSRSTTSLPSKSFSTFKSELATCTTAEWAFPELENISRRFLVLCKSTGSRAATICKQVSAAQLKNSHDGSNAAWMGVGFLATGAEID